jgi:hypothetical protein
LSSIVVKNRNGVVGERTVMGWGSKVNTSDVPLLALADFTTDCSKARCPRWRPSKFPIVKTG